MVTRKGDRHGIAQLNWEDNWGRMAETRVGVASVGRVGNIWNNRAGFGLNRASRTRAEGGQVIRLTRGGGSGGGDKEPN